MTPGPSQGKADPVRTRKGQETRIPDSLAVRRLDQPGLPPEKVGGAGLALTPEDYFRPGAYDVRADPLRPWSQASRDSGAVALAPPHGAGRGGAWRGGRAPRAAVAEEAERPLATRAGESGRGAGAGQGRGAAAALAAGRRGGLGAARLAAPGPGVPGGAENRGGARRPRAAGGAAPPAPVSHRGLG